MQDCSGQVKLLWAHIEEKTLRVGGEVKTLCVNSQIMQSNRSVEVRNGIGPVQIPRLPKLTYGAQALITGRQEKSSGWDCPILYSDIGL